MDAKPDSGFVRFLQNVRRSRSERILGGVCRGLARHSGIPVWVFRAGFFAFSIIHIGIFAYIGLWVFMPSEPAEFADQRAGTFD